MKKPTAIKVTWPTEVVEVKSHSVWAMYNMFQFQRETGHARQMASYVADKGVQEALKNEENKEVMSDQLNIWLMLSARLKVRNKCEKRTRWLDFQEDIDPTW